VVHFEQGIDMSLGGGETQTPVAGSNKYAQIMELMRRRNAMTPQSYTGGFNAYTPTSAYSGPSSNYDEILRLQALNNPNRFPADRGSGDYATGDGYSPNVSPLSNPMTGSGLYGFLDAYGNALGGMLPLGLVAQTIAQSMNPGQIEQAGKLSSQALSDAIAGYTSGTMFGAPPSAASTFGGGGYRTPESQGGYGVTGMTGAGIAANPMGIDPATAQGQQAAQAQAPTMGDPNQGPQASDSGYGMTPDGGIDGSMFNKGGQVTMNRLLGPNPMGPDDGYGGLDHGEYVINAKSVGKYGIELMNAINAGKISKGKLRGLLEA
jgi:hypothetical protein